MTKLLASVVFQHAYDKSEFGTKRYLYKTDLNELQEDDLVVVQTQHGAAVAKFVEYVDENKSGINLKFIIQKVDTESFELRQQLIKQKANIEKQILKRAEELRKRKELEELAKGDDTLTTLLKQLESLD